MIDLRRRDWILAPAIAGLLAVACGGNDGGGGGGAGPMDASTASSSGAGSASSSGAGSGSTGSSSGTSSTGGSSSSGGSSSAGGTSSASSGSSGSSSGGGPSSGSSGSSSGPGSSSGSVNDAGIVTGGTLIDSLLKLTSTCAASAVVSAHTYSANNGSPVDVCKLNGAVYYRAKMAIDCDGRTTPNCPGTGANKDCCYYNDTSFHNLQGQPLAAEYDPYVVIPLDFMYPGLDQQNGGNVVAVIYQGQLEYAVFGDQGPTDLIGEASYRTAANLGINPSPASGGVNGDVTYIVFVGAGTRPADIESQPEIQQLGGMLAQQLVTNNP